jgi:hypothetical protein
MAMDSGAFSFYTRHGAARDINGKPMMGKGAAARADHGYSRTSGFQRYFDAYCQFVRDYGHLFQFCASLDVILNPGRSLELYKEMRRLGLNVLPVYHYGEDVSVLKEYLKDAGYIGLGGLVKTDIEGRRRFLDRTWPYLMDAKGRPAVKVHAFGMSSLDVIARHPYASVDAVTPIHDGATGRVPIPTVSGSGYDYCGSRLYVVMSDRSTKNKAHFDHMTPRSREAVERYVAEELSGLDLSNYFGRWSANLLYLQRAMVQLGKDRPVQCHFYMSGGTKRWGEGSPSCFKWLVDKGETSHVGFLGTYFDLKEAHFQLNRLRGFDFPPEVVATAYKVYKGA